MQSLPQIYKIVVFSVALALATMGHTQAADSQPIKSRQVGIKVGDLVRPSDGGPLMTVRSIKKGLAICVWQAWDGSSHKGRFPLSQLISVGSAPPPLIEPQPYRPCPADVMTRKGRHECLG